MLNWIVTSPIFSQDPEWMMKERRNEWMDDDTAHKSRGGQEGARGHFGVGCERTDNHTFVVEPLSAKHFIETEMKITNTQHNVM